MTHERPTISGWVPLLLIVLLGTLIFPPLETPAVQRQAADRPNGGTASAPVSIEYFEARPVTPDIELEWFVVSEKDIGGFRLYRRAKGEGVYFLVNGEGLIPRWRFDYLDQQLAANMNYQYILGVVHTDGSEFLSYPVEARTAGKSFTRR